jgi:hypothetical protein
MRWLEKASIRRKHKNKSLKEVKEQSIAFLLAEVSSGRRGSIIIQQ